MKKTHPLNFLLFFLLTLVCLHSCKKTDPNSILNNLPGGILSGIPDVPAITPEGIALDTPVTKNIGVGGGSITSADGKIQLTIPAGALLTITDISIQPISNECPGGIGLAYDLLPNGQKFEKPATLIFHYTDEDLGGTDPYFLFMAYQDSVDEWLADIVYRDVDPLAKTVTSGIQHFSGHAMGSGAQIVSLPSELHKGETSTELAANVLIPAAPKGGTGNELAVLPIFKPFSNVSNWKATEGTISGSGSSVTYTAPASIPKKKTAGISTTCKVSNSFPLMNKGKVVKTITNTETLPLYGKITLLPSFSYSVIIEYQQFGTNECYADSYTDTAKMQVDVQEDIVTVSNIQNYPPHVDPVSGKSADGVETCEWVKDAYGTVNVISATGTIYPTGGNTPSEQKYVIVKCDGFAFFPKWHVYENGTAGSFTGGQQFDTAPPSFRFHLTDGTQTDIFTSPPNESGYSAIAKVTIVLISK